MSEEKFVTIKELELYEKNVDHRFTALENLSDMRIEKIEESITTLTESIKQITKAIEVIKDSIMTKEQMIELIVTHSKTCPFESKAREISKEVFEIETNKEIRKAYENVKYQIIGIVVAGIIALIASNVYITEKFSDKFNNNVNDNKIETKLQDRP